MFFNPLKESNKYVGIAYKNNELILLCSTNEIFIFSNVEADTVDMLLNSSNPDGVIEDLMRIKTYTISTNSTKPI